MADQIDSTAVPPRPNRRPRVREVSSRFMSPLIPSNSYAPTSTPDIRRSKSAYRRHLPQTDESLISVANHNSDVTAASTAPSVQKKQYQQRAKFQKHALPNGHHLHTDGRIPPIPDTPAATGAERIVPSIHRLVPNAARRSNSLNIIGNGTATMAARLLQQATSDALISNSDDFESRSGNASNQANSSCPNSPLCTPVNSIEDHNCKNYSKIRSSLNFSSSVEIAGGDLVSRRPHPPSSGIGLTARKVNKVADRVEDEHFLKMSSNRWLQWRFVNAKAEICLRAQKQEVEKKLWSLGSKISDIRHNVKRKCRDFALLQEMKTLNAIVEAQEITRILCRAQQMHCSVPHQDFQSVTIYGLTRDRWERL